MTYYHYTNIAGFYGMVASKKVWLSSLAFMNDESEGYAVLGFIKTVLESQSEGGIQNESDSLIDHTARTYLRNQFAFCASSLDDDLSQWRAYTNLGQGVCIAFDSNFVADEDVECFPCIYEESDKKEYIDLVLKTRSEDEDHFFPLLMDILAKFKKSSFVAEQETRWTKRLDRIPGDRSQVVRYRPHQFGLVPFLEVAADPARIVSVTLGPRVPRENIHSVNDFLKQCGCTCDVLESKCRIR